MLKKSTQKSSTPRKPAIPKPRLVKIGNHYLDPTNVSGIKQAKRGLYVIMLRSNPEPEFPLWLSEADLDDAKQYFDILGDNDRRDEEEIDNDIPF